MSNFVGLFTCSEDILHFLNNEQIGIVLTALFEYAKSGTVPDFGGNVILDIAFTALKRDHDLLTTPGKYKEWLEELEIWAEVIDSENEDDEAYDE